MDKKELALAMGRSEGRIGQWVKKGCPKTMKGRRYDFDLEAVSKWLETQPKVGRKATVNTVEVKDAKRRKLEAEARYKEALAEKEEIELEQLKGKYILVEDMNKIVSDCFLYVRNAFLGLPPQIAPHLVGLNNAEIEKILDGFFREALTVLSKGIQEKEKK